MGKRQHREHAQFQIDNVDLSENLWSNELLRYHGGMTPVNPRRSLIPLRGLLCRKLVFGTPRSKVAQCVSSCNCHRGGNAVQPRALDWRLVQMVAIEPEWVKPPLPRRYVPFRDH